MNWRVEQLATDAVPEATFFPVVSVTITRAITSFLVCMQLYLNLGNTNI
jgi:hypothetical protein